MAFTRSVGAQYNLYNGNLHVHTNISCKFPALPDHPSDDPGKVYAAGASAGLDVIGFSDHGGKIVYDDWVTLGVITRLSNPTAIRGFEWTGGQVSNVMAHVNVFNTNKYCDVTNWDTISDAQIIHDDFRDLAIWLCNSGNWTNGELPIAQFNHIWNSSGFAGFSWPSGYNETLDKIFCLVEIGGGPAVSNAPNLSEESWRTALANGWHVAPSIGIDNQLNLDDQAATYHTGIWASANSQSEILEALRSRRVFASEDIDVSLQFHATKSSGGETYWMGKTIPADPIGIVFSFTVNDPSGYDKDTFEEMDLMSSSSSEPIWRWGSVAGTKTVRDHYYTFQQLMLMPKTARDENCFYVRLKQKGVLGAQQDYIYSAPIWVKYWTPVSGTISEDTTWTPENNPYLVKGAVTVASGKTLTIMPGTVVKFADSSCGLTVNGRIVAQGSSGSPITFTSFKDDGLGGDSNYDGGNSIPNPADWGAILISGAGATGSFEHCVVRYGGGYGVYANLGCQDGGVMSVNNCTISNSWRYGLYAHSSTITTSGCVVKDCETGVMVNSCSSANITGYTVSNCTYGMMAENCKDPTFTSNTVINNNSGIRINNSTSPTLTNNIFKDNYACAAQISGNISGAITLQGNNATGNAINGLLINNGSNTIGDTQLHTSSGFPYVIDDLSVPLGKTLTVDPGCI
ncbi:MAG: right-handed parallel beta-helix repeat-containing protein, partial [Armatimonadota bacterium]